MTQPCLPWTKSKGLTRFTFDKPTRVYQKPGLLRLKQPDLVLPEKLIIEDSFAKAMVNWLSSRLSANQIEQPGGREVMLSMGKHSQLIHYQLWRLIARSTYLVLSLAGLKIVTIMLSMVSLLCIIMLFLWKCRSQVKVLQTKRYKNEGLPIQLRKSQGYSSEISGS
ncbi:hypothetical protein Cgig2_012899 [Carnegiea gigantea]|uniref:Uncharacterized protein n=1 Tax=Carnegiea gigantea TaxID=171969 RepID=A0A9Q1GXE3_9CARY|nr:hypothetical protein Cgig2_012899 [Carnegiea gigantea]